MSLWAVYLVEGKGGAGQGGEALVDRGLEGGQEEEDEELETPGDFVLRGKQNNE